MVKSPAYKRIKSYVVQINYCYSVYWHAGQSVYGTGYLVKDLGSPKRRVMNTLRIRVTIAVLLIATVVIGAFTGQIGNQAPWDKKLGGQVTQPELNQPLETQ